MKTQPKKREFRFKQIDYDRNKSSWLLHRGYEATSVTRTVRMKDYDLIITVVEYHQPFLAKFLKTFNLRDDPSAMYSISKLVDISSETLKWSEFQKVWNKLRDYLCIPLR